MALNTPHKVTLTEAQISTILWTMEGYVQGNADFDEDSNYGKDVNEIFEIFETTVDRHYNKVEKAQSKQPDMEW